MSDFDENWQITGSSDPATPDIQPNQAFAKPQASPYQPPVYQQPAVQPQAAPVQQVPVQPVQPQYSAPVQQTPMQQPVTAPVQPQYQQPVANPQFQQVAQTQYQQPYQQGYQQGYPNTQPVTYGYPAPQQPALDPAYAAEREKSLAEMTKMLNHFSPKVDMFQKYENINREIDKFSKTSVAPLVWGIIVGVFALIQLANAIFWVKSSDNKIPYYVIAGVSFLIAAGLIVLFVLKKKSHKAKMEQLIAEAGELSDQLNLLYNGYGSSLVSAEYVDPRILYKLQQILLAGRCATIPDALNTLLMFQRNFQKIESEKANASAVTSKRYEGKPAFFNAYKYFNLM